MSLLTPECEQTIIFKGSFSNCEKNSKKKNWLEIFTSKVFRKLLEFLFIYFARERALFDKSGGLIDKSGGLIAKTIQK